MSDKLNDELEDAVFRVMMEKVAYSEGEKLIELNEKLKSDPSADIPKDVQDRCLKTIRKESAKRDRQTNVRAIWKFVRFIPLMAIIAVCLAVFAYAAIPSFRANVLNVLMDYNDTFTSWDYSNQSNDLIENEGKSLSFMFAVPDEFKLDNYQVMDNLEFASYRSKNGINASIEITVQYGADMSHNTDFEDLDNYEEFIVRGNPALLLEKDGYISVVFSDPSIPCFVIINTTGVNRDTVFEIAYSFKNNR